MQKPAHFVIQFSLDLASFVAARGVGVPHRAVCPAGCLYVDRDVTIANRRLVPFSTAKGGSPKGRRPKI